MRLWDNRTPKRLGRLAVLLVIVVLFCWFIMIRMPLRSYRGPLSPLTPEQVALRDELQGDVQKLAGEIGERNTYTPRAMHAAADYIAACFTNAGLSVTRQVFQAMGEQCANLITEIRGTTKPDEIIVVGGHYDSVPGVAGANDNASGTAATLALARRFATAKPARTLRFVAFVNEEPPFFKDEAMGSLVYARSCRARGDNIVAMLSLETIGYYSDAASSQKYPFPVGLFYPSRGNFLAFVGKTSQGRLVRQCVRSFRTHAQFPSEGAALPSRIPGVDWSDHWAFWQAGYPAIEVTDTAIFRYRHYHTTEDTPDKLDYDRMARVVSGLEQVIVDLANP
jgi:Zn-dependent M28 family amino/carboxypeptidase